MKKMLRVATTVLLLAAAGLAATQCRRAPHDQAAAQPYEYFCAMHPQVVQDKPGNCPICSMKLERRAKAPARPTPAPDRAEARHEYFCPMHPEVVRSEPGQCPICGMALEKREKAISAAPTVHGRADVELGPEKRRLLGVRSEPVRETDVDRTLRTIGRVTVDETHIHHHHAKFEGYVERLHVDFTGQVVNKGQSLLSIYSPELVATQQEYLLAYKARERLAQSTLPAVVQGSADMLESARRRLLLWDVRPADIERLEKTGEVRRTMNLYAEVSGYVLEKTAFHGMRVTPNDTLFKIANLQHVWVLADVYEHQLSAVRAGSRAEITVAARPGRTWRGPVTFVAPTVEEATRTVKVRVELANPDVALKPDMFADVVLHAPAEKGLVMPESAVIETGRRQLVFVDHPDGRLEPREVTLGGRTEGGVVVTSGVRAGELVVTSANFLLDSESSMKAAVSALSGTSAPGTPATPAGHGSHP